MHQKYIYIDCLISFAVFISLLLLIFIDISIFGQWSNESIYCMGSEMLMLSLAVECGVVPLAGYAAG